MILLLGQVQIIKVTNIHRELIIKEFHLRGIVAKKTELITKMKLMEISHEHPNPMKKEDLKEKEAKKIFHSKLLTAVD